MKALIQGHNIEYHRSGSGEPMILVHGITTYSFIWDGLGLGLFPRYDVIALDLLGCGDSDKPVGADISPGGQAGMIVSLMDSLGLESAHLVTHDIGGAIGQILAVHHPERLRTLTLINTVGYDYWPVQPILTFRAPILSHIAMAAFNRTVFRFLVERGVYHRTLVTEEIMDKYYRPLKTTEGRRGFLSLAKSLNNRQLMDIEDRIRSITMPVMIVRGDADVYLPAVISERLHRDIPGSRLERIETGGHFIQIDEPGWLVDLIIDFCRQGAPAAAMA